VSEYTRPATWDDVRRVAQLLDEAEADYCLVGGYALAAHGFNRFTEDIDVLVDPAAENSRRWVLALSKLPDGVAAELATAGDVFAANDRYAIRVNDEFTIDVMPSICGHRWDALRSHVVTIDLDGVPLRVLDLPGLLKTKEGRRPKDLMDAEVIRKAIAAEQREST
jgi:hypothetical protein